MKNAGSNSRIATTLAGLVLFVGAMTYLAVPLYGWFRTVTGYGGTPKVATANEVEILEEKIIVQFDASLQRDMPWTFRPVLRAMELRIGETGLAFYEISNPTGKPVAGTASFSVSPDAAGAFFTRMECFCFTEQVLQPGETRQLPVTFFVNPSILEGREAKDIRPITLSFTFYEVALPETEKTQLLIKRGTTDGA